MELQHQDSESLSLLIQQLTKAVSLGYSLGSDPATENQGVTPTGSYDKWQLPASSNVIEQFSSASIGATTDSDSVPPSRSSTWSEGFETASSTFGTSASLARQNTILGVDSSPSRSARELKAILGSGNAKMKAGTALPATQADDSEYLPQRAALDFENGKTRTRIQLDLLLENDSCVHDGYLTGNIVIDIRKKIGPDQVIMLSDGKIRLIGFECVAQEKDGFIFYECTVPLFSVTKDLEEIYRTGPDEEGFMLANNGRFMLPFAFHLDPAATCGMPKGAFPPQSGASVRYIAMISIRIKDPILETKSIAHFYRDIRVWPRLDLATCLASLPRPIQVTVSNGEGSLKFTVTLRRLQWIAGQQCYVKIFIANNASKAVKGFAIELHRDIIVHRPVANLEDLGRDKDNNTRATITPKLIAESALHLGDRSEKGHASAKGWWTGVLSGESHSFNHSIMLPPDSLSVSKGKLLEVAYRLKVTISTGSMLSTELSAEVPIQIVNFISFDPPPNTPKPERNSRTLPKSASSIPNNFFNVPTTQSLDAPALESPGTTGAEGTDDIVRDVVVSAPFLGSDEDENAPHFADLYYSALQHDLKQQPSLLERSKQSEGLMKAQQPLAMPSLSAGSGGRTSSSLQAIPEVGGETDARTPIRLDAVPLRSGRSKISHPNGNYSPSLCARSVVKAARSRTLPTPPGPTDVSAFEELQRLETGKRLHMRGYSDTSIPQSSRGPPPLQLFVGSADPPSLKSPGVSSVKDKIRELEERVRAIESVSKAI